MKKMSMSKYTRQRVKIALQETIYIVLVSCLAIGVVLCVAFGINGLFNWNTFAGTAACFALVFGIIFYCCYN